MIIIKFYILSFVLIEKMDHKTIICDPGTGYMKMGFAGDNFPMASFASLVGRPMLRCEESLGEDVQLKVHIVLN
jgi:actin-related protein